MNGFSDALDTIMRSIAADRADATIDPRCVPIVKHHGGRTDRAIVLFHGFTNAPIQFEELATVFFDAGYNVYVPRLPHHGMRDKMTTALDDLSVEEMQRCAAQSAQLGAQLGTKLGVLGLSLGGTMAAWLGQTHVLDRAVAVAPFLGIKRVPAFFEPALNGALLLAPNVMLWWDPRLKERIPPPHGYPRFSTHALARCMQLGEGIIAPARTSAPRAARSVLVLNAQDPAIDNGTAAGVWKDWRAQGAAVEEYVFTDAGERHDIIEPTTFPAARTLVYPVLVRLVSQA